MRREAGGAVILARCALDDLAPQTLVLVCPDAGARYLAAVVFGPQQVLDSPQCPTTASVLRVATTQDLAAHPQAMTLSTSSPGAGASVLEPAGLLALLGDERLDLRGFDAGDLPMLGDRVTGDDGQVVTVEGIDARQGVLRLRDDAGGPSQQPLRRGPWRQPGWTERPPDAGPEARGGKAGRRRWKAHGGGHSEHP